MIKNPMENRNLHKFHLIVACCFYVDYFITGLIISNYEFLSDHDKNDTFLDLSVFLNDHDTSLVRGKTKINDFMDHENIYSFIICIQFLDILINFLIMKEGQTDPFVVGLNYMKGNFLPDLISIFPYSTSAPKLIFLRYIKVIQMSKYQTFFDDFII